MEARGKYIEDNCQNIRGNVLLSGKTTKFSAGTKKDKPNFFVNNLKR
jgi:hypothetical protein